MKMKKGDIIDYKGYAVIKKYKVNYYIIIYNKDIIGYSKSLRKAKKIIDKIIKIKNKFQ